MGGNGRWFRRLPRERDREELMDNLEGYSREELGSTLRDLERVNRIFGNHRLVIGYLVELTRDLPIGAEISLLDIGTGGGDLPAAAGRWAERTGRTIRLIGMDRSAEMIRFAGARLSRDSSRHFLIGDAATLPFPGRSIDIVLCSQVLHHLPDSTAVRVLSEMNRVCRVGWIVSDLRRGRWAYLLTHAAMRLTSRNRMIRHDGPLSILRAYTMPEYRQMARAAGAGRAAIRKHRFFRSAMVYHRGRGPGS